MTAEQSKNLKVGQLVAWHDSATDLGTVKAVDWSTWSFECPKCERVQIERQPIDPMKACSGWVASELRAPT
jgi:hypothetical protein